MIGALAATSALIAVGCGDDDAQQLSMTVSDATVIEGPETAEAGLAEITVENATEDDVDAQLIRIEGDHSAAEVVDSVEGIIRGEPFPEWLFAGGGVGKVAPGQRGTVTQLLTPGTYFAVNTNASGPLDPSGVPAIDVEGDADDAAPSADVTVNALEYGFDLEGRLAAGERQILFENTGDQPHQLIAGPLAEGKTIQDLRDFFADEEGVVPSPVQAGNSVTTAILEGGESQLVTIDLKPGPYALFCFVSDRQGGPPHALLGMINQTEVEG